MYSISNNNILSNFYLVNYGYECIKGTDLLNNKNL